MVISVVCTHGNIPVPCALFHSRLDSILLPWLGRSKDCVSMEDSCIAIGISGIFLKNPCLGTLCLLLLTSIAGLFPNPTKGFSVFHHCGQKCSVSLLLRPAQLSILVTGTATAAVFPCCGDLDLLSEDLPLHPTPGK